MIKANIATIAHILVLGFITLSCSDNNSKERVATPVVVHHVQEISALDSIAISGNVEGLQTVRLGFMVAGKIAAITKQEGQIIKKGQLLAKLDPDSYTFARNMAKAKYTEVKDEYDRLTKLYEKGSLAESDYVKITTGLEQAKSQYELQQKNLDDTKLIAPISGVLIRRGVEPGEIIDQGRPVFAISAIDTVQVNAAVPEGELHAMKLGNQAVVNIPSLGSVHTGKITQIGAVAEPTTRTFAVKINVPNLQHTLKPGMIAEIGISGTNAKQVVALPPSTIIKDTDNTYYVFVADANQSKAYRRKVVIGSVHKNQVEIISGLDVNEWVVMGGQHKLQDGSNITIKK